MSRAKRTLPRALALACWVPLAFGCPSGSTAVVSSPPPASSPSAKQQVPLKGPAAAVRPQPGADPDNVVPPMPKPRNMAEAWKRAATKQQNWRVGIAKAFKQTAEREALLRHFQAPSPKLLRLISFARAFPCYDPGLAHAARFDHRLKRLYSEEGYLASHMLQDSPVAAALLLLADASEMGQARLVLTSSGWQSPRQGLADGSYAEARQGLPRRSRARS
ncbi:MAG: hypothetical protein JKY65_12325 [Planctomycetes bacterium]|nr:hypothetical protein [Planctomycetota bacterium]